jgi:aryl-alcohol dehydrogenase-like predicted oxidoreductase
VELALGTAQFGLPYGVAGRSRPLDDVEARAVLEAAARHGLRWLDTAAAYGDIEQRLSGLCGDLPFLVVSKLPALPTKIDGAGATAFFVDSLRRSRERLGDRLRVVLFHRPDDLVGEEGHRIWTAVEAEAKAAGIELGISCYTISDLRALVKAFPLRAAQLPGNAFDQALVDLSAKEVPGLFQLRSAFLQGLLLMSEADASRRLPAAAPALRRWHAWCDARGLERIEAALGLVKGFSAFDQCVVGVDGIEHLQRIANAWSGCKAIRAPEVACTDPEVIDPRRWCLVS